MSRIARVALTCALLVAACDRSRDEATTRSLASRALSGVLAYPQSSLVNVSAGSEAAQIVLASPASVADVVAWYKTALPLNHWDLKSNVTGRDGVVTLYAEREARPLWITLRPNVGAPGTTYTLIGAFVEPDSAKHAEAAR
jgi:hypothetical protein